MQGFAGVEQEGFAAQLLEHDGDIFQTLSFPTTRARSCGPARHPAKLRRPQKFGTVSLHRQYKEAIASRP